MTDGFQVRFLRLPSAEGIDLPSRATPGSAGYDVRSSDAVTLDPGDIALVPTGLRMELPDGVECQIRPRSGLALRHGVTLPNSPATIDPDYRGELRVILQNLGPEPVTLGRGERIAQLVFARFLTPEVQEVDILEETARGSGGFGSTGRG